MTIRRYHLPLALALLLGGCTRAPGLPPAGGPTGTPQGYPGFDTGIYPGEAAMRASLGYGRNFAKPGEPTEQLIDPAARKALLEGPADAKVTVVEAFDYA